MSYVALRRGSKPIACVACGTVIDASLRVHHDAWHKWMNTVAEVADYAAYVDPATSEKRHLESLERFSRDHPETRPT